MRKKITLESQSSQGAPNECLYRTRHVNTLTHINWCHVRLQFVENLSIPQIDFINLKTGPNEGS